MQAAGYCDSDNESPNKVSEGLNKLKDIILRLKGKNDEFGTILHGINKLQIEIKDFKKMLYDKATGASFNDSSFLKSVDSADRFVTQELEALMKLKNKIDKKIDELEVSIMYEDGILLHDQDYIWELWTSITNIQDSIAERLKGFTEFVWPIIGEQDILIE